MTDLKEGFEFPATEFQIDNNIVTDFLKATSETSPLFKNYPFIPPMAIAARAIGSMGIGSLVPAGVIHVTQQLEFLKPARIGAQLSCHTRVERYLARAGLTIITVAMNVTDETNSAVITGKIGFILPSGGKTP